MAVTNTVHFTVNAALSSGSIRFTSATDWVAEYGVTASLVEMRWGFDGPDGGHYRGSGGPAVSGAPGNISHDPAIHYDVPAPTSLGLVVSGTYTFYWQAYSSTGPINESGSFTVELCLDCFPTISLAPDVNCPAAWVTVEDKTPWVSEGWTLVSRLMTLQYPDPDDHAPITSGGTTVSTGGQSVFSGLWRVKVAAVYTKDILTASFTYTKEFPVDCSAESCKRACVILCFGQKADDLRGTTRAGAYSEALAKRDRLVMLHMMLLQAEQCGLIPEWLQDAWGAEAGDCGCGCTEDSRLITPIWGQGSTYTLTGTFPFIVTPVSGGAVGSIDPTWLASIALLYNTTVVSSDGSVDVGTGPSYDLSVNLRDHAVFTIKFKLGTGGPAVTYSDATGTEFDLSGLTITPTGGFGYYIDGFHSGSAPYGDWNLQYAQNTRIERAPYNYSHRSSPMVDAKVVNRSMANGGFTITFEITQPGLSHAMGVGYDMSVIDTYLSEINVDFLVYKY